MTEIVDIVGIGFGPSNLSVAVALEESGRPLRALFLEAKPEFAWHPGLLFEGSEMQVSFLKDLVSMRNPTSRHSFLNYLAEQGRLAEFVNLRTFYPSRVEFNGYYRWVAAHFAEQVRYGTRVVAVEPVPAAGSDGVELLRVVFADELTGQRDSVLARNLIVAPGGTPSLPAGTAPGKRIFHAQDTLSRLGASFDDPTAPYHFNVVGAGQTAADVFMHLHRSYPNARITTCMRGFAMRPEDDTHFVNEFFLPETPAWFFGLSEESRRDVLEDYRSVAHSGVSFDLIPRIYDAYYQDRVADRGLLRCERFVELTGATEDADGAVATYRHLHSGQTTRIEADAVVLCTGYRYQMPVPLLGQVQEHLSMIDADQYALDRNYAVVAADGFLPRIYLQGYGERTHGFSEVLLSLMPFRAAEIVADAGAHAPAAAR